jgi:beta-1,4-galactosyltransferase 1
METDNNGLFQNIIAIPYRNREQHLNYFIEHSVPIIQKHMPNTKVVVVEQGNDKLFNRGMLLNVAFMEYQNKTRYFITHDVDMNPTMEVVKDVYSMDDIEILRIKSPHTSSLGGIVKFRDDSFFTVNGFPNDMWGWGIEDRALFYRTQIKNIPITENNNKSFHVLPHKSNAVVYTGDKKKISDMWHKNNINKLSPEEKDNMCSSSGLNTIVYSVIEKTKLHPIVELIKVDI